MERAEFHAYTQEAIAGADGAVAHAQKLRQQLRRKVKRTNLERQRRIVEAQSNLAGEMVAIRSLLGALQFTDARADDEEKLRSTSKAIQYERAQLKKMLPR